MMLSLSKVGEIEAIFGLANRCSRCTRINFTGRQRGIWAFLTTDEQVGLLDDYPTMPLQGTHLRSQNGGYNVSKTEEYTGDSDVI